MLCRMRKRHAALILTVVILTGCSNAGVCGHSQPESVLVDASAFATPESVIEVCIFPADEPDNVACSVEGGAWASVTWHGEYPEAVGYTVIRANTDGTQETLVTGSYHLQCQPGTVRIELGVRPGQE